MILRAEHDNATLASEGRRSCYVSKEILVYGRYSALFMSSFKLLKYIVDGQVTDNRLKRPLLMAQHTAVCYTSFVSYPSLRLHVYDSLVVQFEYKT